MQLNSFIYIVFFIIVYGLYRIFPHRLQNLLLLTASFVFIGWWDLRFLFLIVLSSTINYCCGQIILEGFISRKQRFNLSIFIISGFLLTAVIQWNHLGLFPDSELSELYWRNVIGEIHNIYLFTIIIAVLFCLNLIYSQLKQLDEERKRKLFVFIGVLSNLIILGFFKYYNFFIENVEWLLAGFNFDTSNLRINIIFPIGVSFYTFKGISYVVDAYRGQISTRHSYFDFSLYMAFFPAILAGPIDRTDPFLRQIIERRKFNWDQLFRGIHLFLYGLFKKVVIADGVVRSVASVFDSTGQASWIDVVVATFLFTIQIYCDFSGYTDMARGSAKILGIDLMINFRLPYFSKNPREFWSRWHVSLSTWLRDYLYIPLGGNRKGRYKTYRNLIVTMVLGGLWHGAAWNFVLWGLYHGIALSIHRAFTAFKTRIDQSRSMILEAGKIAACFMIVCYGWLLFRAPSFDKIWNLTSTLLFDFGNFDLGLAWPRMAVVIGLPLLCIIEIIERIGREDSFYKKLPLPAWTALYAAIIFSIGIGLTTESTQFIYMVF